MGGRELDPRLERRMAGHDPAHGHDTGGLPWHGRDLTANPFAQDTGEADPHLRAALEGEGDEAALVRAVARARVFVPVVAAPGDEAAAGTDSVAEMATVVLTSPAGDRALPAFTGLDSLAVWDPTARPVPVTAQTLGQAAVQERCDALLIDLGSAHETVLRASMVYALAQGREWLPAHQDVVVQEAVGAVGRALAEHSPAAGAVEAVRVGDGLTPGGELRVEVVVAPGLDRPTLNALLGEVGRRLGADAELRTRIDGLTLVVVAGHGPGAPHGSVR